MAAQWSVLVPLDPLLCFEARAHSAGGGKEEGGDDGGRRVGEKDGGKEEGEEGEEGEGREEG